MICPDTDLSLELYEKCLLSRSCPYTVLGRELGRNLGLFAVSAWAKHHQVRDAFSRLVFFTRKPLANKELIDKDQSVGEAVLADGKSKQGSFAGLFYWAAFLQGPHAESALVFWSEEPYSKSDQRCLARLSRNLTALLNLIILQDLPAQSRVARELASTQFIQKQLMPPLNGSVAENSLSYRTLPAHELGGDYLDILNYKDGSLGLTVADAMGKGVPGAFIMLIARTIFRFLAQENMPPHTVFSALNNQFIKEVSGVATFVTQFYGIYNPHTRQVVYANAGHVAPLIFRYQEGKAAVLPGRGIALGGKTGACYESYTVELKQGDILVIFSDGLQEAQNSRGQQFGVERIAAAVNKYKEYDAEGICDGLINAVLKHCPKP
ncbi:MAG TPA: serine/threonine-protein phosphatase, partial [Firmicutes bacterium]|nr:serine/threonine-protein phosphatase [Bacillota bacterium]